MIVWLDILADVLEEIGDTASPQEIRLEAHARTLEYWDEVTLARLGIEDLKHKDGWLRECPLRLRAAKRVRVGTIQAGPFDTAFV